MGRVQNNLKLGMLAAIFVGSFAACTPKFRTPATTTADSSAATGDIHFADLVGAWETDCAQIGSSDFSVKGLVSISSNGNVSQSEAYYSGTTCASAPLILQASYMTAAENIADSSGNEVAVDTIAQGSWKIGLHADIIPAMNDGSDKCEGAVTFALGIPEDITGLCGTEAQGLATFSKIKIESGFLMLAIPSDDRDSLSREQRANTYDPDDPVFHRSDVSVLVLNGIGTYQPECTLVSGNAARKTSKNYLIPGYVVDWQILYAAADTDCSGSKIGELAALRQIQIGTDGAVPTDGTRLDYIGGKTYARALNVVASNLFIDQNCAATWTLGVPQDISGACDQAPDGIHYFNAYRETSLGLEFTEGGMDVDSRGSVYSSGLIFEWDY